MALKESMDDMKLQARRVREEATVCLHTRVAAMDKNSEAERLSHVLAKEQLSLQIEGVPEATAQATVQMVLDKLMLALQSSPCYNCRTGGRKFPNQSTRIVLMDSSTTNIGTSLARRPGNVTEANARAPRCNHH
jgi:hypothetical protein